MKTFYAVYYVGIEGLEQQISDPLSFERATDLAIALQADEYLEDGLNGNFTVSLATQWRIK